MQALAISLVGRSQSCKSTPPGAKAHGDDAGPVPGLKSRPIFTNEFSAGSEARFHSGMDWVAIVYNRLHIFLQSN
jgi:hypothetical protein